MKSSIDIAQESKIKLIDDIASMLGMEDLSYPEIISSPKENSQADKKEYTGRVLEECMEKAWI